MPPSNPEHETGETDLITRLQGWRPVASALDRDRLLYTAGQAAESDASRVRSVAHRVSLMGLLIASITLGGLWLRERGRGDALQLALNEVRGDVPRLAEPTESSSSRIVLVSDRADPASYLSLKGRMASEFDGLDSGDSPTVDKPAPGPTSPPDAAVDRSLTPLRASRPGGFPGL